MRALLLLLPFLVLGDVYMHNPRGSNDRGCERNDNRNNGNRLFDSQNNDRGGYACPMANVFPCYKLETYAERQACRALDADPSKTYDDISGMNLMDYEGTLNPNGTRTPRMYYYEGSILQIEWTNQHGCGDNPRTHCDIILQYACEDTLTDDCGEPDSGKSCGPRDGVPKDIADRNRGSVTYQTIDGGQDNVNRNSRDRDATETIPFSIQDNVQSDPRYGRHEPISFYIKCRYRERNKGLWTADRNVREDATGTRQNNNGNRNGFECPEERDYYPYWAPSPWKDIAILTDRSCDMVSESQNIKEKYECVCPTCLPNNRLVPNNRGGCTAVGGQWVMIPAHNIPPPLCGPAPATRENNLGNPIGGGKSGSSFNWTIPYNVPAGKFCVLRLRYNISTGDPIPSNPAQDVTVSGTSALNAGNSPLADRNNREALAYKSFVELPSEVAPAAKLGLAINTNQFGRVFEDRSYTFEIRKAPTSGSCVGKTIYNLNVRGKRGSIVDVYPNVEYDFIPNELYVTELDCVHVQWTGSDHNPSRLYDDANGGPPDASNMNAARADRHNMVPVRGPDQTSNILSSLDWEFGMFALTREQKQRLVFLDQRIDDPNECLSIEGLMNLTKVANNNPLFSDGPNGQFLRDDYANRELYHKNCGKLSGQLTPYFDMGLLNPGAPGTYYYMSTRNNAFGLRSQTGILHVQSSILANGSIIFLILGVAVASGLSAAGFLAYRRRSGNSIPFIPLKDAKVVDETPSVPPRTNPAGSLIYNSMLVSAASPTTVVTALYNQTPQEAGELAFRKGDRITVLRKDPSGWWEGRTPDGQVGIFPSNYVQ